MAHNLGREAPADEGLPPNPGPFLERISKYMSSPTTGVGVHVNLTLDSDPSHQVSLSLSGTSTHQIIPVVKDVLGSTQTATQSFAYVSRNPSVATVSGTGLITAVKRGSAIIEVSYPFGNNQAGVGADGQHVCRIYNEIAVSVGV